MASGKHLKMADRRDGTRIRCKVCEIWREQTEYYRKSGYTCKACRNAQIGKQRRESGKQREHDLWARYRLRPEEYNAMLLAQGGKCAICHADTKLVVDHDHDTGKVRGLLCYRCNYSIASVEDDSWLERAKGYLKGGDDIAV